MIGTSLHSMHFTEMHAMQRCVNRCLRFQPPVA